MTYEELMNPLNINWGFMKRDWMHNHPLQNPCTTPAWVNGKKLCEVFPCLAYNNVKDRKWRDKNKFPCYQDVPYARVMFNTEEVKIWIEQNYKADYQAKC